MLSMGGGSSSSTAIPTAWAAPFQANSAIRAEWLPLVVGNGRRPGPPSREHSAGLDAEWWWDALATTGCSALAGAACAASSSGSRKRLQTGRAITRVVVRAATSDEEAGENTAGNAMVTVVERPSSDIDVSSPENEQENLALSFAERAKRSTLMVSREFKRPLTTFNDPGWKYYDVAMVHVQGGTGGLGCKSFRREKGVPFGGPDGGNGGDGGHVILQCSKRYSTLQHLKARTHYEAEDGVHGQGKCMHGKRGQNEVIEVPMGSVVYVRSTWLTGQARGKFGGTDELIGFEDIKDLHVVGELTEPGQQLRVARGGRGGRGNLAFKTHRNNAPWIKEAGEAGLGRWIEIELKLIADIGIVGLPNAGKSSLLNAVTNAVPKVAPYPFSTVKPNLGVYNSEDHGGVTLCDIPGLIEGASEGRGMGFQFLRHIERCRCLIHLVDGNAQNPVADFAQIQAELQRYSPQVAAMPQVVVVNKCDISEVQEYLPELMAALRRKCGHTRVFDISVATRANVDELMRRVYKWYKAVAKDDERFAAHPQDTSPVIGTRRLAQLGDKMPSLVNAEGVDLDQELPKGRHAKGTFQPRVEWDVLEEAWRMKHPEVERIAISTDWNWEDSHERFNRACKATGMTEALAHAGVKEEDSVIVGFHKFLYCPSMIGADSRMLLYEMNLDEGMEEPEVR